MRRLIRRLVAATTSVVILTFLVPLAILLRTQARDNALDRVSQQSQSIASLVAVVPDIPQLTDLIDQVTQSSGLATSVWLADDRRLDLRPSAGARPVDPVADEQRGRARSRGAFIAPLDAGGAWVYQPATSPQGTIVIATYIPDKILREGLATSWLVLAVVGAGLLGLSLLAADRLGRRVAAPITEISLVAHRLRSGELTARAPQRGPLEVRQLATSINRLAEQISELLRIEREAIADLSHRLRTPTTALRLDAESVGDAQIRERLGGHVEHLQRAIDAIVSNARRPMAQAADRRCDAAAVARERASFWSALAADQERAVVCEIPNQPIPAAISALELADLLDVLLDNVFTHTAEGVGLEIALGYDSAGAVRLEVIDQGAGGESTGSPAADWTERGLSTGGEGSSGLGLDIVRRSAQAAGGDLTIRRSVSGGWVSMVTFAPAE